MLETLWALLAIILIDLVLAGDNALIIGMAANQLPEHLRKKAIVWGTLGAVAIRFICVAALTYLLLIPGLRFIGGLMLIYIGWKLAFIDQEHNISARNTFWGAIATIVIADAVMGIDNALGIAAAANGNFILVVFGLLVSVPMILFGSHVVSELLNRWPNLVFVGSYVLFVVALQMMEREPFLTDWWHQLDPMVEPLAPFITALILTAKQYYRSKISITWKAML
jgi:YjbE family integral membrane protein